MKIITIGRDKSNKIVLNDKRVSSFHAMVFEEDGVWYIEDKDSANHTYVDNRKIKRSVIKRGNVITLGPVEMSFEQIIGEKSVELEPPPQPPKRNKISDLEAVYYNYREGLSKLKWEVQVMPRIIQICISLIPLLVSIILWNKLQPEVRYILMGLSTVAIAVSQLLISPGKKYERKLEQMRENFMRHYICPECKQFFGDIPYNILKDMDRCPRCRKPFN